MTTSVVRGAPDHMRQPKRVKALEMRRPCGLSMFQLVGVILFVFALIGLLYMGGQSGPESTPNFPSPKPATKPPPKPSKNKGKKGQTMSYKVIKQYPHDSSYYTQGLEIHNGLLYEGTGLYGESKLVKMDLFGGRGVQQVVELEKKYFGEGITIFQDKLYQLSWREKTGFIYDKDTFKPLRRWTYDYQGWGITHNDDQLIISDGTAVIRFVKPDDPTSIIRQITVTDDGRPLRMLNELEYIDGEIWANVYTSYLIVTIDPETGVVTGKLDLSSLHKKKEREDVLNGIAYRADTDSVLITGKLWDTIYEISVAKK